MTSDADALLEPPPELRYRRRLSPAQALRDLYRARGFALVLAERDLRVRYKQTVLGMGWALLSPLLLMAVFTLLFSRALKVDTGGVPYPVFAYLGLIPWTFFSACVNQGGTSVLTNLRLVNRIYFPREVFPLAAAATAAVDATIASSILVVLFAITGTVPKPTTAWVPLLLLVELVFTLGVTLGVSILIVYLRDVRHALPIVLQLGLFATPVAYSMSVVPAHLRWLYALLDPLAPVMEGLRRAVLFGKAPQGELLVIAAGASLAAFLAGYLLFKRLEVGIADVA